MSSFKTARKEQVKLRLALCGIAGSGKTKTSLTIADGLADLMIAVLGRRGKIALIDTEYESASLYALTDLQRAAYEQLSGAAARDYLLANRVHDFATSEMHSYSPVAYVDRIHEAEDEGFDICIIDSLSHAWMGKDGALDQKDQITARSTSGNSWTAWRDVTPKHNALVNAMLSSPMHIIATMRSKMEYAQNTVNGKTTIDRLGMAAIQREGMEYEFTCCGDLDLTHTLKITKSRIDGVIDTGDVFDRPGAAFIGKIYNWLTSGAAPAPRTADPQPTPRAAPEAAAVATWTKETVDLFHALGVAGSFDELDALIPQLRVLTGSLRTAAAERYNESKERILKLQAAAAAATAATNGTAPHVSPEVS